MREIKFRAWFPLENKMLSWNDIGWKEMNEEMNTHSLLSGEYAHFTPMQFTGLKDMNGKKIYEGDIIKITYDTDYAEKSFYIGEVIYGADSDYPAFDLDPWIDCEMNALSWLKSDSDPSVEKYEVIGNIYQHPELVTP